MFLGTIQAALRPFSLGFWADFAVVCERTFESVLSSLSSVPRLQVLVLVLFWETLEPGAMPETTPDSRVLDGSGHPRVISRANDASMEH